MGLITGLVILILQRYLNPDVVHQLLTFNPADFFTCGGPRMPTFAHGQAGCCAVKFFCSCAGVPIDSLQMLCMEAAGADQIDYIVFLRMCWLKHGYCLQTAGCPALSCANSCSLMRRYLLPPIIFYAGLSVKKKQFFRNLGTIAAFGILGTYTAFALIALVLYGLAQLPNILNLSVRLRWQAAVAVTLGSSSDFIISSASSPLAEHTRSCFCSDWCSGEAGHTGHNRLQRGINNIHAEHRVHLCRTVWRWASSLRQQTAWPSCRCRPAW